MIHDLRHLDLWIHRPAHEGPANRVFFAHSPEHGDVVIKVADGELFESLQREYQSTQRFQGEGVVELIEFHSDSMYRVMVLRQYQVTLFDWIIEKRRSIAEIQKCFRQIATAVHRLHRVDVAHRDLKPDNIFLDQDQSPYLGDFEFTAKIGTPWKNSVGTIDFLSPELVSSWQTSNWLQDDCWALGVILYAMLYQEYPFLAETDLKIIQRIRQGNWTIPVKPPFRNSKKAINLLQGLLCRAENRWNIEQILESEFLRE